MSKLCFVHSSSADAVAPCGMNEMMLNWCGFCCCYWGVFLSFWGDGGSHFKKQKGGAFAFVFVAFPLHSHTSIHSRWSLTPVLRFCTRSGNMIISSILCWLMTLMWISLMTMKLHFSVQHTAAITLCLYKTTDLSNKCACVCVCACTQLCVYMHACVCSTLCTHAQPMDTLSLMLMWTVAFIQLLEFNLAFTFTYLY